MTPLEILAITAMTFSPAAAVVALACYREPPGRRRVLDAVTAIIGFGGMALLALLALHL